MSYLITIWDSFRLLTWISILPMPRYSASHIAEHIFTLGWGFLGTQKDSSSYFRSFMISAPLCSQHTAATFSIVHTRNASLYIQLRKIIIATALPPYHASFTITYIILHALSGRFHIWGLTFYIVLLYTFKCHQYLSSHLPPHHVSFLYFLFSLSQSLISVSHRVDNT